MNLSIEPILQDRLKFNNNNKTLQYIMNGWVTSLYKTKEKNLKIISYWKKKLQLGRKSYWIKIYILKIQVPTIARNLLVEHSE